MYNTDLLIALIAFLVLVDATSRQDGAISLLELFTNLLQIPIISRTLNDGVVSYSSVRSISRTSQSCWSNQIPLSFA